MFTVCKKTLALLTLAALSLLTACTMYDFEVQFEGDSATITDYKGKSKVVTIPPKIYGRTVTEIGNGAFYGCTGLKKVTIPNGVTEIGSGAFSGCTGLTEISVPRKTNCSPNAFPGGCKVTRY